MRDGPGGGGYGVFGFEYFADDADPSQSYVSWVSDGERSHTVRGTAVPPREDVMIGQRLVAAEPMVSVGCFFCRVLFLIIGLSDDRAQPRRFGRLPTR